LYIVIVLLSITSFSATSQEYYRFHFVGKGYNGDSMSKEMFRDARSRFTNEALDRRRKNIMALGKDIDSLVTYADLPVHQPFLDSVVAWGGEYKVHSNWNNYGVFKLSDSLKNVIPIMLEKPFVHKIEWIDEYLNGEPQNIHIDSVVSIYEFTSDCNGIRDYRFADNQLSRLGVQELHRHGWMGQGVSIAVIDNGFRTYHRAFRHLKIIDKYDFIFRDTIVSNESEDNPRQDNHGTPVLGTMAAYDPGYFIGSAPFAGYMLYKTEDMGQENKIEEEYFAAAVERAERKGADIITASLGYRAYEHPQSGHNYENLDGRQTISARAFNRAADLGVICLSSAGNNGNSRGSLSTPSDAIGALAVGALTPNHNNLTSFSSSGPSSDGRIKPDLVAQGGGVITVSAYDSTAYTTVNGTSFSTPIVSGCFASLLSNMPDMSADALKDLVTSNASRASTPDSSFGYGYPMLVKAVEKIKPMYTIPFFYDIEQNGIYYRRFIVIGEKLEQYDKSFVLKNGEYTTKLKAKKYFDSPYYFIDVPFYEIEDMSSVAFEMQQNNVRYLSLFHTYPKENNALLSYVPCGIEYEPLDLKRPDSPDIFAHFVTPSLMRVVFDASSQGIGHLSIYDVSGRVVFSQQKSLEQGVNSFISDDTGDLANGRYYITLKTESGRVFGVGLLKRM